MAVKVLVVEDESDIAELIAYNLRKEGFDVSLAADGESALRRLRAERFDLAVLDLMLPGIQGMELCRILRAEPKTAALPIIMLTAKSDEVDKVLGLEMGADDYLTKPFSPRELVARVRAVLRRGARKRQELAEPALRVGAIEIDGEKFTASKNNLPVELSAIEFRLLLYLAERPGKVMSRDFLLDAVWGGEAYVEPRTVDVHIRRLREKIEDDPAHPEYIRTKRGIGYYFAEQR